ncbi:hypothetical protein ACFWXK_36025 [Streptomyces sp. NPDC059070]|uniref:hypothetical protein n=1 Tax=unclassified Streptomyces TaxID=2593676 RepID=UPI0034E1DC6D
MSIHRKSAVRQHPLTRHALRIGLLAAGAAGVATAAPAQAIAVTPPHREVAIAHDASSTRADSHHPTRVDDTFTVEQFGTVKAADLRNRAQAVSVGCSADAHCRSVALSFQIVTLAGEHVRLNAVNLSDAVNEHCDGCQTLAGAYQFVVSTARPFHLDSAAQRKLADIHRRLDALARSTTPAQDLKQRVDALAAEVNSVLHQAVSSAPTTAGARPDVTVHRRLDGWPTR